MRTTFKQEIVDFAAQKVNLPKADLYSLITASPSLDKGDYTLPCFTLAKNLHQKPHELAKQWAKSFPLSDRVERAAAVGPYLNFFVNRKRYQDEIISAIQDKQIQFGRSDEGAGKTVIIEYSSPNIAKPFHVGHLRTTIIGNALKRVLQHCGYTCVGINYLGDWGTQFGKLIVAFKKWGDESKMKSDPIKHLNALYVRFHTEAKKDALLEDQARAWFKKCEEDDPEALDLWKRFKADSLKAFDNIYKRLDVTFEEVSGESVYNKKIPQIVSKIKKLSQTRVSEGALIVDLEKWHLPPALILRKDGASLYLSRDIALLLDRYQRYAFHKMLYVVGDTQELHFKQLFKVAELMGAACVTDCHHVSFGQVRFKDRQMSTRQGTAILLEEVLDKSIALIAKIINEKNPALKDKKQVAEKVGLGAIIFADFSARRKKNVIFDWDIILNPDGDTGPYVMYTYARASSILRKAPQTKPQPWQYLESMEEQHLIRALENFPKMVRLAAHHFEPSYLATYLIELSKQFNRFYHHHRVIQSDPALQATRLKLVAASRTVIKTGLNLLGIREVEQL